MDKGIYTALSGGLAKSHELELIANNLANVNTPGFKRDTGTFNEYLSELRRPDTVEALHGEIKAQTLFDGRPNGDKSFVEMDAVYTQFNQGAIQRTGRDFDVAIEGDGFLEVLSPTGVRYTRQGNLSLSNDGTLVTISGYPVLSKGTLEPEGRIIRLMQGKPEFTPDGSIYQNGNRITQLSIQTFKLPELLEKVGNSYFRNTVQENLSTGQSTVHQYFLESSNVNPVAEMTKLIEATRAYESHLQAIKTYQEIDSQTVNDIARLR